MTAATRPAGAADGRVPFLGFLYDPLDLDATVAWLRARAGGEPFGYVVTPNVDHAVFTGRDPALMEPYRGAALCVCDSRVLAAVAGACGVDLPVVPGSDLTRLLFERVLEPGEAVCVVGAEPHAVERLRARFPAFRILHCPAPMGLRRDAAARARTAAAAVEAGRGARFWLLAVGSPQQEMLASAIAATPGAVGTALCIGASIDFLTGGQRRAPRALQRLKLEWAWRLLLDPKRLAHRYLVDGPAVFPMAWRWKREQAQRRR
jgi:exopolysaccharide biosynthesis WecB/TagA/CpsF family protein